MCVISHIILTCPDSHPFPCRKQISSSAIWTQPLRLSEQERSHRRHHADPRQQQQPAQLLLADLRPRLLCPSALRPAVHQGERSHRTDDHDWEMFTSLNLLDQSLDSQINESVWPEWTHQHLWTLQCFHINNASPKYKYYWVCLHLNYFFFILY